MVNSPSLQRMMKNQTLTIEELKGWIFKDVMKEMHGHVEKIRKSWAESLKDGKMQMEEG